MWGHFRPLWEDGLCGVSAVASPALATLPPVMAQEPPLWWVFQQRVCSNSKTEQKEKKLFFPVWKDFSGIRIPFYVSASKILVSGQLSLKTNVQNFPNKVDHCLSWKSQES